MRPVVVSNLPVPTSAEEVRQLFQSYGTLDNVTVSPIDPSYAFIEMPVPEEALAAIQALNQSTYKGKVITVVLTRPNPPGPSSRPGR